MSALEPETRAAEPDGRSRLRAYLHRFFTSWVAEDPEPTYSRLDLSDGLGQTPDPVCEPRVQLPESAEVASQLARADRTPRVVAGRGH